MLLGEESNSEIVTEDRDTDSSSYLSIYQASNPICGGPDKTLHTHTHILNPVGP